MLGCLLFLTTGILRPQEFLEEREKVKERIEMIRMWKMIEILDLSREQSEKLLPVLDEIEKKRKGLFEERGGFMVELKKTLRGENPDEDVLKALMGNLEKNRDELEVLNDSELSEVDKILTTVQQARYIIFKESFERELRGIIRDVREKNPAQRPPRDEPDSRPRR
jgi:hypothetical protein